MKDLVVICPRGRKPELVKSLVKILVLVSLGHRDFNLVRSLCKVLIHIQVTFLCIKYFKYL